MGGEEGRRGRGGGRGEEEVRGEAEGKEDGREGGEGKKEGRRGRGRRGEGMKYCLWLSQPATRGQRKQANTCGSKEINASPFLVCRLYTKGAWSLVGQYLEGMEEDAPVISFLSE